MEKFIRCFAYGLTEGETVTANIGGVDVEFSFDRPQVDCPFVAPAPEPAPEPAPV